MSDRLPPHDEPAEQALLGCLLLNPQENIAEFCGMARNAKDYFFTERHKAIFNAMVELSDAGKAVDPVTVGQRLGARGVAPESDIRAYVTGLPDKTPCAANLAHYAAILRELHTKRRLLKASAEIAIAAHEKAAAEAVEIADREVGSVSLDDCTAGDTTMRDNILAVIDEMEAARRERGRLRGLATGLTDLDRILNGLKPGQLIVIAARPACGKTSLATQIAECVALDQKQPVGIFSLEMERQELTFRLLSSLARVSQQSACAEHVSAEDQARLVDVAAHLSKAPLHIDDTGGLTIAQLRSRARRMANRYRIQLLIVDYLQLVHGSRRTENRTAEVTEISNALKALAKELHIPVIALSQLSRASTKDDNREPRLSDLRDSGSIEQDADVVVFIHPTGDYEYAYQPARLMIGKHRNGPSGRIEVVFAKAITRFEAAA